MASINDTYRQIPSHQTIEEAGNLLILDENSKEVPFSSLYTNETPNTRILITFIRHFFCGYCEYYIQSLISTLPQSQSQPYKLLFIGCGSPTLISDYRTRNSIPHPVYADPSRSLYRKLSFPESKQPFSDGWKSRESKYHDKGFFSVSLASIWNGLSSGPKKALGAGPPGQNGGAVMFENGECKFVHRMRDMGDYLEPGEAKKVLGVGDGEEKGEVVANGS